MPEGLRSFAPTTFHISNMGNETEATMQELIDAMDEVLG